MDKPLFNFVKILVLIFVLLLGGDDVLAQVPQAVPGQMRLDAAAPKQASTPTQEKGFADKFVDWAAPEGSILATIFPTTKNCDYVNKKLYQPFSGIDKTFPGAVSLGVVEVPNRDTKEGGKITCIKVASGTEGLLKMLFTLLISIIIILSVINISVSGIQYMTEEATGQIKGGAKKRLQNSLIALALGLLSYTILYTVNKQLVAFNFNPGQLDTENSIDGGIAKAAQGLKEGTYSTSFANVEGLQQSVNVPGLYGPSVPNSPYLGAAGGGSIVDAYNTVGSWNERTAENWVRGLNNGQRSTDGRLVVTVYSATKDKITDTNTAQRRGNSNNLLREGSVALSPDLISRYKPQTGQEVYINGTSIGYYEDATAAVYNGVIFNNTVDIYDENGTLGGSYLKNIPAGQWTIYFGQKRAQILNR